MIKSLEQLGYLNAKFDLEKQYPEQYAAIKKDLLRLDRFITWNKTSGISGKQRSYAEAIAKTLKIDDFDITKYDKKSIKKFFDTYAPQYIALKQDQQEDADKEQSEKVTDDDIPF